ncbi:MAG: hypothetical protein OXI38_12005 [Bacteroidota bacterium]|nr:hypothetical protein [Bacteroidota bacterium]
MGPSAGRLAEQIRFHNVDADQFTGPLPSNRGSCEDGLFLETDSYIFNPNSRVSFALHSDPDDSLAARERIADVSIVGPGNTAILLDVVQQLDQNHLA